MIYVSQGHEHGIGIEVFLKSILCLSKKDQKKFHLYIDQNSLEQNLITTKISREELELNITNISNSDHTFSDHSLKSCINNISKGDLLITLPTSKDQLFHQGVVQKGHTEFFRAFYGNQNISMLFNFGPKSLLLLTDHIPIDEITKTITIDLILKKVSLVLNDKSGVFKKFRKVIFSGINPHCGENGLLGNDENTITTAMETLRKDFPLVEFLGPFSGDFLYHHSQFEDELLVYSSHDQGLSAFKGVNGLNGYNITLGLPFTRLSVDHGTAFEKYGKNTSNYSGCLSLLDKTLKLHEG
ncbi:MAG: hypothetical protein HOE90_11745 [Bacteriovoracaceae bacterium]|jgi:4-hydroxythreonine-4-phosphate dehydrogenase|nr:hypothetical protein [Bacteriovoracaceae bacterium]